MEHKFNKQSISITIKFLKPSTLHALIESNTNKEIIKEIHNFISYLFNKIREIHHLQGLEKSKNKNLGPIILDVKSHRREIEQFYQSLSEECCFGVSLDIILDDTTDLKDESFLEDGGCVSVFNTIYTFDQFFSGIPEDQVSKMTSLTIMRLESKGLEIHKIVGLEFMIHEIPSESMALFKNN